jgi:uncharacterized membrane protein
MTQAPQQPVQPAGQGMQVKPHRGVMILIFGILAFVCCFIFGIAAWVMGNKDLKEMDAGRMDPEGRGLTNAGRILGMVGTIIGIIGFIVGTIKMGGMFG